MKPVSERGGEKGMPGMAAPPGIRWVRVLLVGVAVHVAADFAGGLVGKRF